jgi:hypothetical protein
MKKMGQFGSLHPGFIQQGAAGQAMSMAVALFVFSLLTGGRSSAPVPNPSPSAEDIVDDKMQPAALIRNASSASPKPRPTPKESGSTNYN